MDRDELVRVLRGFESPELEYVLIGARWLSMAWCGRARTSICSSGRRGTILNGCDTHSGMAIKELADVISTRHADHWTTEEERVGRDRSRASRVGSLTRRARVNRALAFRAGLVLARTGGATDTAAAIVGRIWRTVELKPHVKRSFKLSPDPQLAPKHQPAGKRLGDPNDIALDSFRRNNAQRRHSSPFIVVSPCKVAFKFQRSIKRNCSTAASRLTENAAPQSAASPAAALRERRGIARARRLLLLHRLTCVRRRVALAPRRSCRTSPQIVK